MKLLIVRHAIALDKDEWKQVSDNDRERPITEEGAKKMKKGARGLVRILNSLPDCVISSPLLRAKQTAAILLNEIPEAKIVETETLAPEHDPEAFTKYLRTSFAPSTEIVACVGHEPHLNHLISWLASKSSNGIGEMKKGGACLIEFEDEVGAGKGNLIWLLTAKQLRTFAKD